MSLGLSVGFSPLLSDLESALTGLAEGTFLVDTLSDGFKEQADDAVSKIRSSLMSMQTSGIPVENGMPLRQTVANKIQVEKNVAHREFQVSILIPLTPELRGFNNAARSLNSSSGWVHPVFSTGTTARQTGKPGYFDDNITSKLQELEDLVESVGKDFIEMVHLK